MFTLVMEDSPQLHVKSRQHQFDYAVDGSLANPLEATYAALTGCAGVYARKACLALGVTPVGIVISCKPTARPDSPLMPSKITTDVKFPEQFNPEMRQTVMDSILACPVKSLIMSGSDIEFIFHASDA